MCEEAAELAADEADRTEMAEVAALMESLRPPSATPKPAWLHKNLVLVVGIAEAEVRAMSAAEAHARWREFINRDG